MKKTKILSICVVLGVSLFFTNIVLAQLVIEKNNVEDFFSNLNKFEIESAVSTDTDKILTLFNSTGADQTWDFTDLTYTDSLSSSGEIEISTEVANAPLGDDPHFAQATHVVTSDFVTDTLSFSVYNFQQLTDTASIALGSVIFFEGDSEPSTVLYNRPGIIDLILPASFSDSWQFMNETEIQSGENSSISNVNVTTEIDGWGTLITPEGEFEVLRIKQIEISSTFGIEFTSNQIKFINSSGAELANITTDEIQFVGIDEESVQATVNKLTESVTTSNEPFSTVPSTFLLEQNYPNPFNPSTTIEFSIPEATLVKIQVYDMLGREVGNPLNQNLSAGRHQVSFDASALSSGIYLYTIQAGSFQQTRKMTLIK